MKAATACAVLLVHGALAHAGCSVNAIGLNFGEYDPFRAEPTDIATSLGVTCDTETSYEISLSSGLGAFSARTMLSGPNLLYYNLFADPAHLTLWGDGSPGTATVSGQGLGGSYTVYGRISPAQNAHVGTYGDTITVTVTF